MAKIKNVLVEIQDRLVSGQNPADIAKVLGVPLHWVTEAEMDMDIVPYPLIDYSGDYSGDGQ